MMFRYRMLFLDQRTFLAAAIGALVLLPVSLVLTALAGQLTIFIAAGFMLELVLCAGLTAAWRKEDVIRISGLVAGILLTELCLYVYQTERSLSVGVDGIVAMGLTACMVLSACLMVCFILLMVTYNHFSIRPERNSGRTKLIANQLSLCVLLLCFLFLTGESWLMDTSLLRRAASAAGCLSDLCLFVMVACCELYLAVDGRMLTMGLEKEE